ncbi:MAG: zf-HC2 domain-containing protein, partial [Acidobacteria bacterium]|nr:zf-HC2 domain-containing protein [Acidobacteriota bacterium]
MLDTRRSGPNCSFAEGVVSYLYDEMNPGQKLSFEQHLENCRNCGEELAAFGSVSTSIRRWRESEFANVPTPAIILPRATPTVPDLKTESGKGSWIANLLRGFDLSSGTVRAAAACSLLVVFLGLGWFIYSGSIGRESEVANKPNKD